MSKYNYPTLSRDDIVTGLAELQITSISEEHLLKPTYDFLTNVYTNILIRIEDRVDHDQVDFSALELLENPDAHVDSVRAINLFCKIRQMLATLECPETFTVNDLIKPTPSRTCLFVGSMLNFLLYRDTKLATLTPSVEGVGLVDERRQALEARLSQLNAEIAECNESRETEMPLVQQIDSEVKELRQTISGLNNHQMSLKASIKKLKERVKEMDEKISNADFALVQAVHENANLQSKIVQSPDKLQKALGEKKSFLVEARNAERAAMQSYQDKTAILEVYMKAYKKMSKHLSQMQAIQEQVNSYKSIEKDVKALKLKLNEEEIVDKSLESKLVEMQGKANKLDELKGQIEKERDIRREEAARELKKVELEVESKRQDLEKRQKALEGVLAEADAITAQISSVRESGASVCQELYNKCKEVLAAFYQYCDKIEGVFSPLIKVDQAASDRS